MRPDERGHRPMQARRCLISRGIGLASALLIASVTWTSGPRAEAGTPSARPNTGAQAGAACPASPGHLGPAQFGINLAGPNFAPEKAPGEYGRDYTYPDEETLAYYHAQGFRLVRLTFLWERLQPDFFKPFNPEELGRVDRFIEQAQARGMAVVIGPHNYARYRVGGKEELIGSSAVPVEAFEDFWERLSSHYRDQPQTLAYTLMNEPHDTGGTWKAIAQKAVDAIRRNDPQRVIYVPGDQWSGAWRWRLYNADLILNDPSNRLIYEAHQYFDRNGSGFYRNSYDDEGASPNTGVERLKPFLSWLREHNLRGSVTEYGVPNDDPRWLKVLDAFLTELKKAGVSGTYWAGGPWWGDYPLSSEPRDGKPAPVMAVLTKFLPCANSRG